METVNIHEAKTHLSRLVERAGAGEEILIAKAGKPIARLMPLHAPSGEVRRLGLGRERFKMPANFDSLDAEEIRRMFEEGK